MNVNELIQFVKSFISIFINNNSENELTSHISRSLTFLSSIHTLQKNVSLTQL